jgi:TolB-like protein
MTNRSDQENGTPSTQPDAESIRAQVERIAASDTFEKSKRLVRFLEFTIDETVAGRGADLKEYIIGVKVYGRHQDYNPQTDSIVRSEARRLRAKLTEYYATQGHGDSLLISYPKGTYTPIISVTAPLSPVSVPPPKLSALTRKISFRLALPTVVVLLAVPAALRLSLVLSRNSDLRVLVLPFESLSDDTNGELGLKMAQTIANKLKTTSSLIVLPPTSAARSEGKSPQYVISGAIVQGGNVVRVRARLLRTSDSTMLWTRTLERKSNDAARSLEEISTEVAGEVTDLLRDAARKY